MDFWEILEKRQLESGLNQEQFATAVLGIDRSTLSRLMSGGKPSFDTMTSIADSLGLELLAEPARPPKPDKSIPCTDAELRSCLERIEGLDNRDINELVGIVHLKKKETAPKEGAA
jgi:transcriptional regulator with XRE-family HTH domain